jgi:hypothetical protein
MPPAAWPLSGARLPWLESCCAVAEGADVPLPHAGMVSDASSRCPPDVCVAAVLGDALQRLTMLVVVRECRGRWAACTVLR